MDDRDMMYGGFYQNLPGNMSYGNFGFQGMPGSLMPITNQGNMINNNPLYEISSRINNLENRVKILEQRIGNINSNSFQDDNSMYML
ncbi:MAG: hypothetical protein IJZ46_00170 [Bacilli bacterium]|nr:hypothetical protein [Bacilli bacterium]